jgi:alanine racemase
VADRGQPSTALGSPPGPRPVWAEVDVAAVRHNVSLLRKLSAPARLCAVVKADGYGHGALSVSRAAVEAGASWLAVALVEEGEALRAAGVNVPVLLLSEPPPDAMDLAVALDLTPTVYTRAGVRALADAAAARRKVVGAHVKVDTGMHRVGVDPDGAAEIVGAVVGADHLRFAGLWTHLAVADGTAEEDRAFTRTQLARFRHVRRLLADAGLEAPLHHAANSAGAICHPDSRLDLVRCGIAVYGLLPAPELGPDLAAAVEGPAGGGLRPVLSLRARVSMVRALDSGERPSYGRRYPLPEPSVVATVPVGYADGVPRRYFEAGGTVLIGGRRRPLAGTVTMDQIVVDCGPDPDVAAGDEVVLIGGQGDDAISAWDWARTLDTIAYEVVCGVGPRVPRVVVDGDRQPGERDGAGGGRLAPRTSGGGHRR